MPSFGIAEGTKLLTLPLEGEVFKPWKEKNHTVTEFILLGFTTDTVMQLVLFVAFLGMYSVTVVGNTTLIVLISNDSQLHVPMYFFIKNLSVLDLWYSSVYTPKILVTCISENKSLSFAGCVAQFFFSAVLAYSKCYLLSVMAYDLYVAISKPLLYAQTMSGKLCICLVIYSYTGGFVNSLILTSNITLDFCGDNVIDDFFCDVPPLVNLSCDVKERYQAVLYFLLVSNIIAPTVLILASYLFSIAAILRICFTQGCLKAFSTCSFHLVSVTLYYGSILYIYSRPSSSYSLERNKMVSTFYTVLFLMLNPTTYSLRNKDIKETEKTLLIHIIRSKLT
ncbi:LOW QUALITY PROTEIN: olfactory receptor 9G19-like [Rhynchonycteris naso]